MRYLIDRYFVKQPKFRRLITRLLYGDREQDVDLLGASVRIHTIKENGYLRASRMIAGSSLLRDELAILINLAALFRDGDTFVDIGANVGIYSLTLARTHRILPRTRFYAFEANPDTFSRRTMWRSRITTARSNSWPALCRMSSPRSKTSRLTTSNPSACPCRAAGSMRWQSRATRSS
jgi:hypothetical protein